MSDWPAHYDNVFSRLKNCRRRAEGRWVACCPAHDDSKPSLHLTTGDQGKLIMRCMSAKCDTELILKAMGLAWKDLFVPNEKDSRQHTKRKVIAYYPYLDENRQVICETLRYDPKDFRQRRPNPDFVPHYGEHEQNPKWLWNLEGCRKIIYRLPDIIEARRRDPNVQVAILEGEKDCDNVWALGFPATTCPMGAGKWTSEHSEYLRDTNVLIIPDEDLRDVRTKKFTGLEHAKLVRESLTGVAKSAKIIRFPCEMGKKADATSMIESWPPSFDVNDRRHRWQEFVSSRLNRNVLQEVSDRVEYDRLRQEQLLFMVCQGIARFQISVAGTVRRETIIDLAAALVSLAEVID